MTSSIRQHDLPPGQQWAASDKWPTVGERSPRRDDAPWSVRVEGAVARTSQWSLADLRDLPQVEQTIDIHCVTRWSKPAVRFSGVPLAALVQRAVPRPAALFVSFVARSARRHSTSLVLAEALAAQALVALSVDGSPLDETRGGPIRLITPGRYFYKSLKWLERVELLAEDRLGFWEDTAGYHNRADPRFEERYLAPGITKAEARTVLQDRDISGRDLRSLDADGRDLAGLVARSALLRDADFRRCRLIGACFDGANLTNAHFAGADLRDASFRDADLEGADFSGADLRGARLWGASLFGASFFDPSGRLGSVLIDHTTQIATGAVDDLAPVQLEFLRAALDAARPRDERRNRRTIG